MRGRRGVRARNMPRGARKEISRTFHGHRERTVLFHGEFPSGHPHEMPIKVIVPKPHFDPLHEVRVKGPKIKVKGGRTKIKALPGEPVGLQNSAFYRFIKPRNSFLQGLVTVLDNIVTCAVSAKARPTSTAP